MPEKDSKIHTSAARTSIAVVLLVGLSTLVNANTAFAQQKSSAPATKTQKSKGKVVVEAVEVEDALDEDKVHSAIESSLGALRACYQRELKTQPVLRGDMDFRVLLNGKGQVVSATVENTSLGDEKVARCARNHAMSLRVKVPPGSGHTTIRYALRFIPSRIEGQPCERMARCCASQEVQSHSQLQAACQMYEQLRDLPTKTRETACETALKGLRGAVEVLSGTVPLECL